MPESFRWWQRSVRHSPLLLGRPSGNSELNTFSYSPPHFDLTLFVQREENAPQTTLAGASVSPCFCRERASHYSTGCLGLTLLVQRENAPHTRLAGCLGLTLLVQREENAPGSREVPFVGQLGVFKSPDGLLQLLDVPALRGVHQLCSLVRCLHTKSICFNHPSQGGSVNHPSQGGSVNHPSQGNSVNHPSQGNSVFNHPSQGNSVNHPTQSNSVKQHRVIQLTTKGSLI